MLSATMSFHSTALDLEQYINGQLATAEAAAVQTHLAACEECQLRLADIAFETHWQGAERRTDPRVPVDFSGRLKLLDPVTSVGPPHDVRVLEISRSGMKIRTPRFLIRKTLVQIHFNGKTMLGEVAYCERTDTEYQAGIRQVKDFPSA
jgi:hypothetical protein